MPRFTKETLDLNLEEEVNDDPYYKSRSKASSKNDKAKKKSTRSKSKGKKSTKSK
jgi:hypothetical protein